MHNVCSHSKLTNSSNNYLKMSFYLNSDLLSPASSYLCSLSLLVFLPEILSSLGIFNFKAIFCKNDWFLVLSRFFGLIFLSLEVNSLIFYDLQIYY